MHTNAGVQEALISARKLLRKPTKDIAMVYCVEYPKRADSIALQARALAGLWLLWHVCSFLFGL